MFAILRFDCGSRAHVHALQCCTNAKLNTDNVAHQLHCKEVTDAAEMKQHAQNTAVCRRPEPRNSAADRAEERILGTAR